MVRTSAGPTTRAVAVFAVESAVTTVRLKHDFLRFVHDDSPAFRRSMAVIAAEAGRGTDPAAVNRLFWLLLAGQSYGRLLDVGREWFRTRCRPGVYTDAAVAAVAAHRSRGDLVLLVSDAFPPCVEPLAEDLGADLVVCAEPVVDELGAVTGEVIAPMVGSARAAAVRRVLRGAGVDPRRCTVYADHGDDLEHLAVEEFAESTHRVRNEGATAAS